MTPLASPDDGVTHGRFARSFGVDSDCGHPLSFRGNELALKATACGPGFALVPSPVYVCDRCRVVARIVPTPAHLHTDFRRDPVSALNAVRDLPAVSLEPYQAPTRRRRAAQ